MRAVRPDPLSNWQREALLAAIGRVTDDTETSVTVTYRRRTESSYSRDTGDITTTDDDTQVGAYRRTATVDDVANSDGVVEISDVWYLISTDALDTVPQVNDRIIEDGTTRRVVHWEGGGLGLRYRILSRST